MPPSLAHVSQLRSAYNAQVTGVRRVHDHLLILRVRPEWGRLEYLPGQYTVLGLGNWESPATAASHDPQAAKQPQHLVKRAYSISSAMLDPAGRPIRPQDESELEFYIALVDPTAKHAAGLTPRLFNLSPGDRLFLGPRAHGNYTLQGVRPDEQVVFAATGTGEAPHNAMLAELLSTGRRGRIAAITCVRHQKDLAYLETHRRLQRLFPNYLYLGLTTREPQNLDSTRADYVGKAYLQDYFASGRFEEHSALRLDPARTHIFLCGNPAMIGAPPPHGPPSPQTNGMVELLVDRGFVVDQPHRRGNLHFEQYWQPSVGGQS